MTEATTQEKWLQEYASRIADHIAQYRRYLGISAEELSKLTEEVGYKIPRSSIANIENHKKKTITSHELSIIAAAFGIPPEGLIWNVLKPSEIFSYTPTSQKLPGYRTMVEASRNWYLPSKKTKLTEAIRKIEIIDDAYSRARSDLFHARTSFKTLADRLKIAQMPEFEEMTRSLMRSHEITAASYDTGFSNYLLDSIGIESWPLEEHWFRLSYTNSDLTTMYLKYASDVAGKGNQIHFTKELLDGFIAEFESLPRYEKDLIAPKDFPNEPVYTVTEQDKIRHFPNYHGD